MSDSDGNCNGDGGGDVSYVGDDDNNNPDYCYFGVLNRLL
jgi:hypothetical protein